MKKPFLLLSLLLTFGLHADCAAWGTVGHRAIAEVAQRHLTPKAKAAIERYTGGTPLAEYAVFMDEVPPTRATRNLSAAGTPRSPTRSATPPPKCGRNTARDATA